MTYPILLASISKISPNIQAYWEDPNNKKPLTLPRNCLLLCEDKLVATFPIFCSAKHANWCKTMAQ